MGNLFTMNTLLNNRKDKPRNYSIDLTHRILLLFAISLIFIGCQQNNVDSEIQENIIEEIKFNRSYALKEILSEIVENEDIDTLFVNKQIELFENEQSLIYMKLNNILNKCNNEIFFDTYYKKILKKDILKIADELSEELNISIIKLIFSSVIDNIINSLLLIVFVYMVSFFVNYINIMAILEVIYAVPFFAVLGFIISFFYSPSETIGFLPKDKIELIDKKICELDKKFDEEIKLYISENKLNC